MFALLVQSSRSLHSCVEALNLWLLFSYDWGQDLIPTFMRLLGKHFFTIRIEKDREKILLNSYKKSEGFDSNPKSLDNYTAAAIPTNNHLCSLPQNMEHLKIHDFMRCFIHPYIFHADASTKHYTLILLQKKLRYKQLNNKQIFLICKY